MSNKIKLEDVSLSKIIIDASESKEITTQQNVKMKYYINKILYTYGKYTGPLNITLPKVQSTGILKSKKTGARFLLIRFDISDDEESKICDKITNVFNEISKLYFESMPNKKKSAKDEPVSSIKFPFLEDEQDENLKSLYVKIPEYKGKYYCDFINLENKRCKTENLTKVGAMEILPTIEFRKIYATNVRGTDASLHLFLRNALVFNTEEKQALDFTAEIQDYISKNPDALNRMKDQRKLCEDQENDKQSENKDNDDSFEANELSSYDEDNKRFKNNVKIDNLDE